ncbi:MAG: sugar porter family MFS transporter [Kiritimatiellae bacterium]|nr:sugar porter family MFS transporter [Kiritimatiellia bacterium]
MENAKELPANVRRYAKYLLVMAGLGGLLYGIDVGVIAAALPYIEKTSSYTSQQLSFVVSAVLFGSVLSSLFAGAMAEWLGRKKVMLLSALCFSLSIPVICASALLENGFVLLTAGRILQGASAGLVGVVVPMYLAECLDANSRGKGTGMFQLLLTIGLVFAALVGLAVTYLVGASDDMTVSATSKTIAWQTIFWASCVPGLVLFFGTFKLKESPRWLYKRGRKEEALNSLAANNGVENAKIILEEMIKADAEEAAQKAANKAAKDSLLQKKYVVPFVLAVVVLACTQATGVNSALNFSVKIFQESGLQGAFANWADLGFKIVNVVMTVIAVALVDKKGRTFLLKLGTSGIIVGLCTVATTFLALHQKWIEPGMGSGIAVLCGFVVFIAFYAVGPGVCVWLALSELMPNRIRANGMSIALLINQGVSTTIASTFLPWADKFGYESVFFTLAGFTVIYFITAAFFLPETKGKTLEEIEAFFK